MADDDNARRPRRTDRPARPPRRDGDRPRRPEGERPRRPDGDRPRRPEGERPRRPDGDRPRRPQGERRSGGDRRPPRPAPGSDERRERIAEPELPEEITARDLQGPARNELKTLSKENADAVARHLAMAARLIEDDPERAHEHALAASRRAGRIAVVRETVAITAYALGDFALALRELRTYRRISGRDDQLPLIVDSERGVGRPDRALEEGRAVDRATLPVAVRVELAIAMSGARLDLGETERALQELDIPGLDPDRAFEWSPGLFAARAAVLEELGRAEESAQWYRRADVASAALDAASGDAEREVVVVDELDTEDTDAVSISDAAPPQEAHGPESGGAEEIR